MSGVVFCAGLVVTGVYFLLPRGGVAQAVAFHVLLVGAVLLVAGRVVRDRRAVDASWWLLLAGEVVYVAASVGWYMVPVIVGRPASFPSINDGLYLLSYVFFGAFLLGLSRNPADRRTDRTVRRLVALDAALLAAGACSVLWLSTAYPDLGQRGVSTLGHAVAIAYPAMTLLLLAVAARSLLGGWIEGTTGLLILGWIGGELVGDIFYGAAGAEGSFYFGSPINAGWLLSYSCLAALAVRPGLRLVGSHAGELDLEGELGPWRQATRIGAGLLPLGALAVASQTDGRAVPVLVAISILAYVLRIGMLGLLSGGFAEQRRLVRELDELSQAMQHRALHDELTGLGNRRQLAEVVTSVRRSEGVSVVMIDLDRFKAVNDTYGHHVGDEVLRVLAERLRSVVRQDDLLARLGGDEFAILMRTGEPSVAEAVGARAHEAVSQPIPIGALQVYVNCSVGVATGGSDEPVSALMARADACMYGVKKSGRVHRVAVFDPSQHGHVLDMFALSTELRGALARGEFVLHYQPIVDMVSRRPLGFEALVRWAHPERGMVTPLTFIPLAEQSGLMPELGGWVLEEACRQARLWVERFAEDAPYVSVNLSVRQLQEPDFVARLRDALRNADLAPGQLVVEVTESVLATDLDAVAEPLEAARRMGVRVYLDDFGTGYSSLGYIRDLPLDGVKLDRAFTRDLTESDDAWSIARAVVAMFAKLGLGLVAEGVESAAHLAQLRSLGCSRGQGYYFARPQPAEVISGTLEAMRR